MLCNFAYNEAAIIKHYMDDKMISKVMALIGSKGGAKAAANRRANMTEAERSERARKMVMARIEKRRPTHPMGEKNTKGQVVRQEDFSSPASDGRIKSDNS